MVKAEGLKRFHLKDVTK